MTQYLIQPLAAQELFPTSAEAITQAETLVNKYGREAGGFVVYSVIELGRFEHVSPIWIDNSTPSPAPPSKA